MSIKDLLLGFLKNICTKVISSVVANMSYIKLSKVI